MASGDVGWVGLSVTMSNVLVAKGYVVAGLSSREYIGGFTDGPRHLSVDNVPPDFRAIRDCLRRERLLTAPVVLSGVSEGAALSLLAASNGENHTWVDGLLTMGIPETAELAWRWKDIASWIRKTDPNEPSFPPYNYVAGVSPVPFAMIQSTRDEYVSKSTYERGYASAGEPKKLILIDAANHRFTDRQPALQARYLEALDWIRSARRR
jgi:alpha-beta hydrolase superfamily lysophospholipase